MERLTNCKVLSSHSDISTKTGERIEVFIMDRDVVRSKEATDCLAFCSKYDGLILVSEKTFHTKDKSVPFLSLYETSFNPTAEARIRKIKNMRQLFLGSLKRNIPKTAPPDAPIPVQMA